MPNRLSSPQLTTLFTSHPSPEQPRLDHSFRRRKFCSIILTTISSISTANAQELALPNTSSLLTSLSKQEEEDLLNSFGRGLSSSQENNNNSNSGWPNAPSPLPTTSRTAAELSDSFMEQKQNQEEGKEGDDSSLENIMRESQGRKRIINPMTHG